ncbi:reversion-inducing cysteine-rich protein with Kazal motifs isoform X2 [Papilio machaon]|uniref:reversion-inducing cysteine-rich protein with Kazal motifs isoform X2 n=1 Tax=Papilio machaon TaxID=76193 RepID=UPI001E66576F|nr:reversion-inducing cysteine-rich protein with Kazal motifs isoform X2 [Papilio machaon]
MNGAGNNEDIKNINIRECSGSNGSSKTKVCRDMAGRACGAQSACGWWCKLIIASFTLAFVESQELSACCSKANGTCRSVCEKMSLGSSIRDERIQNIYKFCTPDLIEFWICMNQTIQEVVSGSGWWGKTCCALAHGGQCRHACATAGDARALTSVCRRSDEIAFFDCVQRQQEAQWCCSQTVSLSCHEACERVVWRVGLGRFDSSLTEHAADLCEGSPALLRCLYDLTASTVHTDTSKYLPCCQESASPECRKNCEEVLRRTGESQEIADALALNCGAPAIHDELWQCFLRKDAPLNTKNFVPYDAAKLHCCEKAVTINCKKLCFETYNIGWPTNGQKFYSDCLVDPQEMKLIECIEEVEAPCSLGCAGLTYCSQLNNRPTTLFRACSAQADLNAHVAVAERKDKGSVLISGLNLPLKNSSQCPTDLWKSVACTLHVKPCSNQGHSSLLCVEDCIRVVSSCVEWSRVQVTAAALCARLARPHAPCVSLHDFMNPSTEPALLSPQEVVTSPCAGSPCNASQMCVVNRNCAYGADCKRYACLEGCPLGDGSSVMVPTGSWVRVPVSCYGNDLCYKVCRCEGRVLAHCQQLPPIYPDSTNCRLHDKVVKDGEKYYMECNPCKCVLGERVCARRACGRAALLTGLPCNCPPHHLPVTANSRHHANACLAKCAGVPDALIEFGATSACARASCPRRHVCLPRPALCLSQLSNSCPQHICVNTTHCKSQPPMAVCDTEGRTHVSPCHLVMSHATVAYWGRCLKGCSTTGTVCGLNGVTYMSECAAWSEYVSVDYLGPCFAVGPISDLMEPKCRFDRIVCPPLKKPKCIGFTAPGACCPKCGGALRILYAKKQFDRALYGTNISDNVVHLSNILKTLERHIKIAECALRGYLTVEMELFISVESLLDNPTDLQLQVCVLEAEKLGDLINRGSALITSDVALCALSYAIPVHTTPTQSAASVSISIALVFISTLFALIPR